MAESGQEDFELRPELRLLLACGSGGRTLAGRTAIADLLAGGVDWTLFAGSVLAHGLMSSAAHTLVEVAPDRVPGDILDALRVVLRETGLKNRGLFEELGNLIDALATDGIAAIPIRGPVLAGRAYGGLGRRDIRTLEFLVSQADQGRAIASLNKQQYDDSDNQHHWPTDRLVLFGRASGTPVEPHARLAPHNTAFGVDYPALWERARHADVAGKPFLTLAPEDELLALALHGASQLWRNLKRACDLAAFITSQPQLDWRLAIKRARAQGCLRNLLAAAKLVRTYLYAPVPDWVIETGGEDHAIAPAVRRILQHWRSDEPSPALSEGSVSLELLRMHDGMLRRMRYVARTLSASPTGRFPSVAAVSARMRIGFERLPYALARYDAVLGLLPAPADAKQRAKRYERAHVEAKRALARTPSAPVVWRDLGDALSGLRRYRQAIAAYDKAQSLAPQDTTIWKRRIIAQQAAGIPVKVVETPPDVSDAKAWAMHASRLFGAKRFSEAIEASDRALALEAGNIDAARVGIHARLWACDWSRRKADERLVSEEIKAGRQIITPFYHRAISDSEAESLLLARSFSRGLMQPRPPLWQGKRYRHRKIRIAYSSTDFRDHVVADVMVGCFENHDKSLFETTAVSLGPDDGSATRRRITAAVDHFVDVKGMNDLAIAKLIRELEIDIVVDLNGYSGDRRMGIFAHRPAPVQATFQGYAGTTGMPFFDYVIADRFVIPPEHRVHYSEKIIYLPHSWMPHDCKRLIAERTPSRAEAGLPVGEVVFACHNHEYKLSPEIFDVWMRLLKTVEGSVLWLKSFDPAAMINVRREASARGVAPERIIFAPRLARVEDHLARLRLADLFLDTRPYNAHATACDALWVGLPIVTCPGNSFPSRVAASVLYAGGMPELVAQSLTDYEAIAAELAMDPQRLAQTKAKLMRNRVTEPLFNTPAFTRALEGAYTMMWERQQQGEPPASFAVDRAPVCAA